MSQQDEIDALVISANDIIANNAKARDGRKEMIAIKRGPGEYPLVKLRVQCDEAEISILADTDEGNPATGWPCIEIAMGQRDCLKLIELLAETLFSQSLRKAGKK